MMISLFEGGHIGATSASGGGVIAVESSIVIDLRGSGKHASHLENVYGSMNDIP